jgi:hypothetical protein
MPVHARCVLADLGQTESRVCYSIDEIRLKSPLVLAEESEPLFMFFVADGSGCLAAGVSDDLDLANRIRALLRA